MNAALSRNNSQWRWDVTSDTVIWNTAGNVLYKCTINSGAGTMSCVSSHVFNEYAHSVVFPGNADVNPDGWVPMVGQNVNGSTADIFMFNLITQTKSAVGYTTTCTGDGNGTQPLNNCIHGVTGTPNDGFEVNSTDTGLNGGDWLWEPGFSGLKNIQTSDNHNDTGKDLLGNEVAAYEGDNGYFNAGNGAILPCTSTYNPVTVKLSSSMMSNQAFQCLFDIVPQQYNSSSWHVSFRDWPNRPWVVYSQQGTNNAERWNNDGSYQNPSASGWALYDNEIMLARVDANGDPSKLYRLALSHSRELEDYFAEPHAVISRSGNYILFGSNAAWGATGCGSDGNPTDCDDLYLMKIH